MSIVSRTTIGTPLTVRWRTSNKVVCYGPTGNARGTLPGMKSKPIDDFKWTAQHDLVVESASPEVAAEKLGRTIESVLARRTELGLSDPLSSRERRERHKKD